MPAGRQAVSRHRDAELRTGPHRISFLVTQERITQPGMTGPVPVPGPARTGQEGQSATVTSVPLTVTTAAGVDGSRHSV